MSRGCSDRAAGGCCSRTTLVLGLNARATDGCCRTQALALKLIRRRGLTNLFLVGLVCCRLSTCAWLWSRWTRCSLLFEQASRSSASLHLLTWVHLWIRDTQIAHWLWASSKTPAPSLRRPQRCPESAPRRRSRSRCTGRTCHLNSTHPHCRQRARSHCASRNKGPSDRTSITLRSPGIRRATGAVTSSGGSVRRRVSIPSRSIAHCS